MNAMNPVVAVKAGQIKPDYLHSLRKQQIIGLAAIALFSGTVCVWSMTTSLQGAVATSGHFVVASEVKKVQHQAGGVVAALPVHEGQQVRAGDIVLRLDETVARANYQIVSRQLDEFAVKTLRLTAERDGASALALTPEIEARSAVPDIAKLLAAENRLFEVRRSARDGQRAQLRKRITQLADEIKGLKAQQVAKEREAKIITIELAGVEDLYKRNLIQLTRLSVLQRDQANIEGQRGQLIASVAQAEGKIAEIELQIIQIDEDQRAEVMKELAEIKTREGELVERRTTSEVQLKQIDLRAPASGTVHQLAVHTVGGVLQPGEVAMLIVPGDDALLIDTRISPTDIDQITLGQVARVRVQAGNQSSNPELVGKVSRISADVTRDERQNTSYYTVQLDLPRSEIERLEPLKIIAGMQVEAFIETVSRRPVDFLLKPIATQFARTFRER